MGKYERVSAGTVSISSSPSDLHTPPFFQSTRREIWSETTDNLSEDTPVLGRKEKSALPVGFEPTPLAIRASALPPCYGRARW